MRKESKKAGVIFLSLVLIGLFVVPIVSASLITDIQNFFKKFFGGDSQVNINDNGELASLSGTCNDSDGKDYYNKGNVISSSGTYEDYCSTSSRVLEYYCSGDRASSLNTYCSKGCSNGACLSSTTTCTDSDGGDLPYISGTVVDKYGRTKSDYCTASGNYLY